MSRIAVLCAFVVVACSSGTTSSPGPTGPAIPPTPDAAPAPVALTREECEAMVMHVVDLTVAEQGSAAAPGDREKVRAAQEPFMVECATARPEVVRCATSAKTLAEVEACQRSADSK